jgi:uncharacterized protein
MAAAAGGPRPHQEILAVHPGTDQPSPRHHPCVRCGTCCRWPGYVRLRDDEADRIAAHLELDPRDFIERYTRLTEDRRTLTLIEGPDGGCIMLTEANLCRINPVKPRQCRDFPVRWRFPGYEALCRAAQATDDPGG